MNKIVALTGATGFVGGHLLNALLSQGYIINALTRQPRKSTENLTWINGDLQNTAAIKELICDADIVINLAGLVKARSLNDFNAANSVAVTTILNEINALENKPHFIQISTLAAREAGLSHYASSKFDGEQRIINNETNLNWTILRPPAIYGPRDLETLKIFKMIKFRLALYPDNKHNRASWLHVEDLSEAILKIMEQDRHYGKIIEIDDGQARGYSHEELFNICSEIMEIKPLYISIPKFILKLIGHSNDIIGAILRTAPMVSSQKVNELCHSDWVCHNDEDNEIKGWHPKYDLNKGLKQVLKWYKDNQYI